MKHTPAVDGSKVLFYDKLNTELFYSTHNEKTETMDTVILMVSEVAETIIKEMHDPWNATSNYLTKLKASFVGGSQVTKSIVYFLVRWKQMILQRVCLHC